jgi:hypothetical protein
MGRAKLSGLLFALHQAQPLLDCGHTAPMLCRR